MENSFTGFWIKINDEKSANYAVQMSSLPLFLLGISLFFAGVFSFFRIMTIDVEQSMFNLIVPGIVIGPIAMVFALMLRKGKGLKFLPGVNAFMIVLIVLQITFQQNILTDISGGWLFMAINAMALLVAISGMRGWFWLRKNGKPV